MEILEITILFLFILSTALLCFIWFIYVKFRVSIKHPNYMFFIIVSVQILSNILIISTAFIKGELPVYLSAKGSTLLIIFQYSMKFLILLETHYILIINLEIFLKLKRLKTSYRIRFIFSSFYAFSVSFLLTAIGIEGGDEILPRFDASTLIFEVYVFLAVVAQLGFSFYFHVKHRKETRSKKMSGILILTLNDSLIICLQVLAELFTQGRVPHYKEIDILTYFLHGLEGIIEFIVFYFSKKMNEYIVQVLTCKEKKKEEKKSLNEKFTVSINFPVNHSGLLSDLFDSLTKNALITIFIGISLRFLNVKGRKKKENLDFSFGKSEIDQIFRITKQEFIKNLNPKKFDLVDMNYKDFQEIREKHLKHSILDSFSDEKNFHKIIEMNSEEGGKSGSYVFVTSDNKFTIKTITREEMSVLTHSLLGSYKQRILGCSESRLVRIFACFYFKKLDSCVIIMENVLQNKGNSVIFDLKGSTVNRSVKVKSETSSLPVGTVLKDMNFRDSGKKIALEKAEKMKILNVLEEDFQILKFSGIMDYSLLLSFQDLSEDLGRLSFRDLGGNTVTVAIIDILQTYDISKFGETLTKSVFHNKNEVSSVEPELYFSRFIDFLQIIFL